MLGVKAVDLIPIQPFTCIIWSSSDQCIYLGGRERGWGKLSAICDYLVCKLRIFSFSNIRKQLEKHCTIPSKSNMVRKRCPQILILQLVLISDKTGLEHQSLSIHYLTRQIEYIFITMTYNQINTNQKYDTSYETMGHQRRLTS